MDAFQSIENILRACHTENDVIITRTGDAVHIVKTDTAAGTVYYETDPETGAVIDVWDYIPAEK